MIDNNTQKPAQHRNKDREANENVQMKDPVCGMAVDQDSPHRLTHAGTSYLFCSAHCLDKFRQEPEKYTRQDVPAEPRNVVKEGTGSGEQFICPMHPEVIRNTHGSCPKCGMALEPRMGSPEEDE